jgi:hypothetical protein
VALDLRIDGVCGPSGRYFGQFVPQIREQGHADGRLCEYNKGITSANTTMKCRVLVEYWDYYKLGWALQRQAIQ